MKPLLAHKFTDERWLGEFAFIQPKLNGVRALYQNGSFQSRDEIPWNEPVLRHLAQPLKLMFPDERTILDGELYVHGWPLQKINGAISVARKEPTEETYQVEYHIFDVVSFSLPFEERFYNMMRYKSGLFNPELKVRLVPTIKTNDPSLADDFYASQVELGYEGIMYRLGDCPYTYPKQQLEPGKRYFGSKMRKFLSDQHNRCYHLLKRKDWHDYEFECIGIEEGKGRLQGSVGALVCKTPAGGVFGVGSGLSDSERAHYLINPPIGKQVKVKFLCYTSGGIPFNPTVLAVL